MTVTWQDMNHRRLIRALDRVYATIARTSEPAAGPPPARRARRPASAVAEAPTALERLSGVFGLTPFEQDVLLLCAGIELQARFAGACAAAQQDARLASPTFSLALAALRGAHWSAISRDRPLRYWHLIEVGLGDSLLRSPLRIDERILHYLAGVPCADERLEIVAQATPPPAVPLSGAHGRSAQAAGRYWTRAADGARDLKPVLLIGRRSTDQAAVAREACRMVGIHAFVMHASDVPAQAVERELLARLWNREALLIGAGLYIQTGGVEAADGHRALGTFLEHVRTPVAVEVREGSPLEQLDGFRVHIPAIARAERRAMWVEGARPAGRAARWGARPDRRSFPVRRRVDPARQRRGQRRGGRAGRRGSGAAHVGGVPRARAAVAREPRGTDRAAGRVGGSDPAGAPDRDPAPAGRPGPPAVRRASTRGGSPAGTAAGSA